MTLLKPDIEHSCQGRESSLYRDIDHKYHPFFHIYAGRSSLQSELTFGVSDKLGVCADSEGVCNLHSKLPKSTQLKCQNWVLFFNLKAKGV